MNEAYDIIVNTHITLLHPGKNKTYSDINDSFYGITREEVAYLVRMCKTCLSDK